MPDMSRIRLAWALARLADSAAWKSSELDRSILPAAAATTAPPALFSFKSIVPRTPRNDACLCGKPKPGFRGGQGRVRAGAGKKTKRFQRLGSPIGQRAVFQ